VHARDRFFQMDQNRRIANGTLAELLGAEALASDVQLRTIGLRRAAQRSLAALSLATRSSIAAYTRGVNAWLAANPLPPEYSALELARADPWTDTDSVVVAS
jgi:penicillin G amidase